MPLRMGEDEALRVLRGTASGWRFWITFKGFLPPCSTLDVRI
jgi:hypothetical protein